MRIGYFDCFSGVAGDMILAAVIDAGCPLEYLQEVVGRLRLPEVAITAEKVRRGGMAATYVRVAVGPAAKTQHRHLPQILEIIGAAGLPTEVAERAIRVFRRLAEAEAAVHGIAVERVHFHEVGAADALVDVVGACAGIAQLGLKRIMCSPIPTGSGTVQCEHGMLPVPAPATANLLRGVPLAACDEPGELTTPTGAAIVTTLAGDFGPLPAMRMRQVGYGAGTREGQTRPNLLRLIVGEIEASASEAQDRVVVLECQLDDCDGQRTAYCCEALLAAGAVDAYVTPIIMKKGRPGQLLTVLARPSDVAALEGVLFAETTTLGVRRYDAVRSKLVRELTSVATAFGPVRVKVARRGGSAVRVQPEYEDCAAAAQQHGVTLQEVQDAARRAWREALEP